MTRRQPLEFQVDCFATAEEANAYMLSEAFASNPIGVPFDPEELVAQFWRGVPERELPRPARRRAGADPARARHRRLRSAADRRVGDFANRRRT
jgi:hypothetical protein